MLKKRVGLRESLVDNSGNTYCDNCLRDVHELIRVSLDALHSQSGLALPARERLRLTRPRTSGLQGVPAFV